MAPKLNIPERHKPSIITISKLDDITVQRLREAITHVSTISDAGTITSLLAPLLADTNIDAPNEVADALSSLYRVRSAKETSTEDFVEAISNGMASNGLDQDRLRKNLTVLLGIDEIGTTAKAWNLQTENERVFCDARIITDLRPVFGTDISSGAKAMVVTHFLKLGYHRQSADGRHEDIYVSLDADDLDTLQEIVERAKAKAKVLKATIKNFTYMARS